MNDLLPLLREVYFYININRKEKQRVTTLAKRIFSQHSRKEEKK